MGTIILNRNTKVVWCNAVANVNAPTISELNASTSLETLVRTDGLQIDPAVEKLKSGNLGTKYDWERFGIISYAVKLGFHHDTTADTAWSLFPFKTSGFLAIRRGLDRATAWASGQGSGGPNGTLLILPLECGMADETNPPGNWDFELDFALIADPGDRAVVA